MNASTPFDDRPQDGCADATPKSSRPAESSLPPASAFPPELARRELGAVRARRAALGLSLDESESTGRVGLAISGGGIRSATFALGVLQALARLGRLRHVDYLSTVSGGGYIGSFLGSLYLPVSARKGAADAGASPPSAAPALAADRVERALADAGSAPLRWLREYGRYMAPRGAGDHLYGVAIYLRNWVALHFVLAATLLAAFMAGNLLRAQLWQHFAAMRELETRLFVHANAGLWWSPWLALPLAGFALVLVPLGWAYWLTQTRRDGYGALRNPALLATLLVAAGAALALCWPPALAHLPAAAPGTITAVAAWLLCCATIAAGAWFLARLGSRSDAVARNHLSRRLASALAAVLVLAAWALVDTFGQTLYRLAGTGANRAWPTLMPLAFAIVAFVQRFAPLIGRLGERETGLRMPVASMLSIAGFVLFALLLAGWSAVGHAWLWASPCADCTGAAPVPQPGAVATALVALAVVALLIGRTIAFVNLSTLAQFYAARLTRAYLGASSAYRSGFRSDTSRVAARPAGAAATDVTRASPDDDIRWQAYHPELHGGPLHFVNVTLNETVTGAAQLTQRDRKGLAMAVGPHALSIGRHHHALWDGVDARIVPLALPPGRFALFPADAPAGLEVEALGVGQWVAISGAAFTTGLGARTRTGLSMLLALSNVRLGYWWNSGVAPRRRHGRPARGPYDRLFALLAALAPVQGCLANETFARFHGPHRQRWYLSDGGHFENTGAYELLRRRVPFIIVCDDGQDPDCAFEDVGNLVRKARIDWNAEIHFLSTAELVGLLGAGSALLASIGTPAQLQRRHRGLSGDAPTRLRGQACSECHATLAWARYADDPQARSLMLFLKPTLTGDEPLDLHDYRSRHPDFPQQSTLDQSFDEAQWESYRRLGEHIGQQLFGTAPEPGHWAPCEMRAPATGSPRAGRS